jgi:leucyl/phenylalanyl-tRNA--protein transferase
MSIHQDDIVGVGGRLDPDTLIRAYRRGIFPWPVEGLPLLWFCPRERAILEFSRVRVGRSLARARRQSGLRFSVDDAFEAVIRACATTPRPGQDGTWITDEIESAYTRLHALGIAHSVEAWRGHDLVAGVYGVAVDGAFAAESMFHREPNASKLALLHLVEILTAAGLDWIDIQVMTPHLERLGAHVVPRGQFLGRLARTRARGLALFRSEMSSRSGGGE